jgi:hypothetical protein
VTGRSNKDKKALGKNSARNSPSYEVGYAKPPVRSRFAKGISGNPSGRPRRRRVIGKSIKEILAELVTVREGNRTYRMSKYEAINTRLVNEALKGEPKALFKIIALHPYSELSEQINMWNMYKKFDKPVTAQQAIDTYNKLLEVEFVADKQYRSRRILPR